MSNPITVRPATPADLDTVAQLIALGFNQDETAHRAGLKNNPRYKVTDFVLAEIDGQAVGTGGMFTTQMWLSGVPLQMGAVCDVTTHPDFRQQGVSKAIMDVLLEKMTAQEVAVSVLFPTAHAVYQNAGYTTAALWHAYRIKPQNLLTTNEAAHVRLFKPEDLPALRSIYRGSQLSQADGRLTRSTAHWDNIMAETYRSGEYAILVYDEKGVEGYVKCHMTSDGALKVIETVVSTDEAYRGLWSYLATRANINAIEYLAPADDPILHLLRTPGDSVPEGTENLPQDWYYHNVYHATASFMFRVISVKEALTGRFYPHNMMGNRVLKVHDPKIPQNEAPINFRIVDGRPDILPIEGKEPDLETDIVTFSQIYCGFLPPDTARRLGRLKADDDTIAWIERAMRTNPLYIHPGDWF